MYIKGLAKKGKRTKQLVNFITPINIPIICHRDIDELAAYALIERGIKAIINCERSITGRYPARGAALLEQSGIIIIDIISGDFFDRVKDNDIIEINKNKVLINGQSCNNYAEIMNKQRITSILSNVDDNFIVETDRFIDNTLKYAHLEKKYVLNVDTIPDLKTEIASKHALIVVRGCNYKDDLMVLKDYIFYNKPVLIGVDGAGDAMLQCGMLPDIIVGDMDSVSDDCLKMSKEIIVHAYPNGNAPGMRRVLSLGLKGKVFPFPGTSEDVAMLLAYEKKAELIVALGTHSNVIDFLEKGRNGMASTMLTRLKIGSKLVDLSGVSKLYKWH